MRSKLMQCGLLSVSVLWLFGCGPNTPKCIPVSGKVTMDGGKVPGPGFIYFTTGDSSGGELARPGTAEFDAEGNYRAKTFVDGDGLLPGKYLLRIDCWKTAPNMDGKPVVSFIPKKYEDASTSGIELVVKNDARSITFDVPLSSK